MAELIDVLTVVEAVTAVNDDDIISVIRNGELYKISAVVFKGVDGAPGTNGLDGTNGVGVPEGGTEGQLLSKKTASDYDTEWADPPSSAAGIVDLTSATEDYALAVGETAYIDYNSATSVPLHIATVEGIYELQITGDQSVTIGTIAAVTLSPNNTTVTAGDIDYMEQYQPIASNSNGTAGITSQQIGTTATTFVISNSLSVSVKLNISTKTTSKFISSSSFRRDSATQFYYSVYQNNWLDTTTAWSSLGTITFPFAQSGKIVIKRVV